MALVGFKSAASSSNCSAEDPTASEARLDRWKSKWEPGPGKASWHIGSTVHPRLKEFEDVLLPSNESARVLVPLAGKTFDVAYLVRRGHKVVAVEGVKEAIDEFEDEFGEKSAAFFRRVHDWWSPPPFQLTDLPTPESRFRLKGARFIHVPPEGALPGGRSLWLHGDFLLLAPPSSSPLTAVGTAPDTEPDASFAAAFDRGGLVAVNPADRPAYAATLARLVAPRGRVLLVAVEHPPFKNGSLGPPFNVGPEEVMALFEGNFEVELLRREDRLPLESVWAKRGCSFFNEATYLLTRKAGEDQRTAATKLA